MVLASSTIRAEAKAFKRKLLTGRREMYLRLALTRGPIMKATANAIQDPPKSKQKKPLVAPPQRVVTHIG